MEINKELKERVLKDMPVDLNDMEKAIYIYIKLCKILSYKTSYYAHYLKDNGWENRICNITPNNNEVVCYEFSTLLKLFFDIFNFKSIIHTQESGHKHTILSFRNCDIEFDSTKSIVYSDMFLAKINDDIEGIFLKRGNELFSDENLKLAINKIYKIVKLQESTKIEEKINDIKKNVESSPNMSQDELIELFKTAIGDTLLSGVDNLGYLLLLNNILSPKRDLLRVNLAGCFVDKDNSKKASAGAIIGINKNGFRSGDNKDTMFYWYHDDCGLVDSNERTIMSNLNNHKIYFCSEPTGPGMQRWGMFPNVSFDVFLTPGDVANIVDASKSK